MMQLIEQTHDETVAMYMKVCTKKQIAEMLVNCNEILSVRSITVQHIPPVRPVDWTICNAEYSSPE